MPDSMNRRNFVKFASGAAAGAALAGCAGNGGDGGSGTTSGSGEGDTTSSSSGGGTTDGSRPLEWIGPAWAVRDGQADKFTEMTDISVNVTTADIPTTQQQVLSGGQANMDMVSSDSPGAGAIVQDNDASIPVPVDELDNWNPDLVSDLFTNPTERLSHLGEQTETVLDLLWADDEQTEMLLPPHVYNFDAIGYNPTQVDDVSTWSALFDDQYSGQVAMGAVSSIAIPETLMHLLDNDMIDADIGQLNNPTEEQMDQAVDFLVSEKQAGQFRSTWTAYGTSVNLMASEEAILGDLWQPAAMDVRRSGTPCTYATMSEGVQGYRYWYGGIAPLRPGARDRNNLNEVYSLINDVHYGAWFPGYIQNWGYSVPHYPNQELVRTGSDESGEGMGPEYYDWAYEGESTYTPLSETQFESEALFDPMEYEWSMEEGDSASDGIARDSGPIEERIDRIGFFQIWPDNSEYMLSRWSDFTSA
ncbi:extracellular solute-binding protein [Haloferax volcanii]|nr:extracellular solute-binding protein [Haloferax volcanii]MDW7538535.1 extracellular solute-binding protein [Haloferax volcanii]